MLSLGRGIDVRRLTHRLVGRWLILVWGLWLFAHAKQLPAARLRTRGNELQEAECTGPE
jgi:hypothetical protein